MIRISFPDGRVQEYAQGVTAHDIAISISEGLARNIIAAKVNGHVIEINRPILSDSVIQLLSWNDKEGKSTFWHSSAHLMAEALEAIYPGTKFGIGPSIDNGFYYDVDTGGKVLSLNDLQAIEAKMAELAKNNSAFIRKEISKKDAIEYFTSKGDEYKLELLQGLEDGSISFYTQGSFTDLCRGPHIPNTGLIKAIKLTNLAGAYWRGDESRQQMTRIYGISFPKQKELDEYLILLEEAKKRDHRKIGQELELFMFSERVGMGLPIWLPKGTALRQRLEDFLKEEQIKRGYTPVITPHIGHKLLYQTSGHWEKYGADSFQPIKTPREGEEFMLKPMNCPHHCEIYGHKPRSYRELPIRIAEFGTVYRYEQSGELHGLTRVRCFTQDDAHLFCTPDQVKSEFLNVLELTMHVIKKLGFDSFTAQISLRDPENKQKYIGSDENWAKAEQAIIDATLEAGLKTVTAYGEAAFYGPKLDFMVKDALGRSWQLGTIQVDYNLPERFQLEYIGSDNAKHRPVMIHRAPFGSMERFIGVLTEHCAGKFPLWLTPDQYMILTISDKYNEHANLVHQMLITAGLRGDIDDRLESIGKKIRDNELKKIPFMLIIGEKESQEKNLSYRRQGSAEQGSLGIQEFIEMVKSEL
ncbi:MAG: threonine--tRNA ligase [Saprospiraceae bacterium]|nr:threonine--tRNA ligase [Saprospiraceae bacterium]